MLLFELLDYDLFVFVAFQKAEFEVLIPIVQLILNVLQDDLIDLTEERFVSDDCLNWRCYEVPNVLNKLGVSIRLLLIQVPIV